MMSYLDVFENIVGAVGLLCVVGFFLCMIMTMKNKP